MSPLIFLHAKKDEASLFLLVFSFKLTFLAQGYFSKEDCIFKSSHSTYNADFWNIMIFKYIL